ncbi:hypothetical protein, partial [Pseudovibrio exalbescens]
ADTLNGSANLPASADTGHPNPNFLPFLPSTPAQSRSHPDYYVSCHKMIDFDQLEGEKNTNEKGNSAENQLYIRVSSKSGRL